MSSTVELERGSLQPGEIFVLHVDDEPGICDLVAEFLEREDDRISVKTASSPTEGLDILGQTTIDCIISDYDMPRKNGIEFLETVREEYQDLPFILYTGKGSEEVASEAVSTGVTDYLQKGSGTSQYTVLANRVTNAVEQYRSLKSVEETEQKLSEIAEGTNDVLFMFDGEWSEILFVNSAYEDVWNGSIAELKANPQSFLNLVHPDDREKARKSMERISNGERDVIEYRIQTPEDDDVRWIRGETKPILDSDGNVDRIVGFTSDITEQKEREQELIRQSKIFERAQEVGEIGWWLIDLPSNEISWSEQVYDMWAAEGDVSSIDYETFLDFIHPEDVEYVDEQWETAKQGEPYDVDHRIITGNGDVKWMREVADLTFNEGGEPDSAIGIVQDITERKEREQKLRREKERLNEFASVVSHDLRNPLNVAQGRIELAREEYSSDHLEEATVAIERSLSLIEDMLALAKAGKQTSDMEPVDISSLAHTCWEHVETREATILTDLDPRVSADKSRLQQLFENLFRNAIEHGGETVTIKVGTLPDGFYVEDDGPGIPEAKRMEVFEPGFSTRDEGAGFGLSIIRQIVKAHDWGIRITESTDGGARFEITGVEFPAE